mmetsp:Transcript_5563/g.12833  ORF Transcript_5563/g.12833 Transcript_5563/m.12833 type:complete len:217 (-) Transcript_5563:771-1421(-)
MVGPAEETLHPSDGRQSLLRVSARHVPSTRRDGKANCRCVVSKALHNLKELLGCLRVGGGGDANDRVEALRREGRGRLLLDVMEGAHVGSLHILHHVALHSSSLHRTQLILPHLPLLVVGVPPSLLLVKGGVPADLVACIGHLCVAFRNGSWRPKHCEARRHRFTQNLIPRISHEILGGSGRILARKGTENPVQFLPPCWVLGERSVRQDALSIQL